MNGCSSIIIITVNNSSATLVSHREERKIFLFLNILYFLFKKTREYGRVHYFRGGLGVGKLKIAERSIPQTVCQREERRL